MSASLASVLLLGLLAGGVSCAAAQGGLLAALAGRRRTTSPTGSRARDDLAPVGGFLAGKLLSHTALGLLLGAVGTAVRPGPQLRASVQIGAGLLIVVMGLAQLGLPALARLLAAPSAWAGPARRAVRSASSLAPLALGATTVLIPCGATLTVMALAVASASPWQGAAVLAVFVVGTAPLFTVLGYAAARARRVAGALARPLSVLSGAVIVALGAYTLNGGLELTGAPIAASALAATVPGAPEPADGGRVVVDGGRQRVLITATGGGYHPADLRVAAGLPTTLVVRAQQAHGCARTIVIPALGLEATLPADGDTPLDLGVLAPGRLAYSCAMGMYTGSLTVVDAP